MTWRTPDCVPPAAARHLAKPVRFAGRFIPIRLGLVIPGLLLVTFWRAFGLGRFGDDWNFVILAKEAIESGTVLHYVTHPASQHWSPLWHSTEVANYLVAGFVGDGFIRSFNLVAQALSLLALLLLCLHLRLRALSTAVAMLVFALHHTSAVSLYSFDTYSQCATDCLGWWGALLLIKRVESGRRSIGALQLVILLAALLYKEQGLATAAVYVWILLWSWPTVPDRSASWRRAAFAVAPTVAMVITFAFVRNRAGVPTQFEGVFKLSPLDTPKNVVQMFVALLSPVRTVAWFDAFRAAPPAWVTLGLLATALCAVTLFISGGALLVGRARERRTARHLGWVAGAMVLSFFPTSLMAHVGELYVHTSLFWFALLAGIAMEGWLQAFPKLARIALPLAAAAYVLPLGLGQRANLSEMRQNGERAVVLFQKMSSAVVQLADGSPVQVCDLSAQKHNTDYSLYRMTTNVALLGLQWASLPEILSGLGARTYYLPDVCKGEWLQSLPADSNASACVLIIRDDSVTLHHPCSASSSAR
jgi:hypothetical protein